MSSLSLGYLNSYQRTQMNLRGLSYWMLPSQPVSRLGYSRLAKVRSQQLVPGGASMSLRSQCASPLTTLPVTISCLVSSPEPTARLSESADPPRRLARCAPWWGAHAAAYTEDAAATDKNRQASCRNILSGSVSPTHFLTPDRQNLQV